MLVLTRRKTESLRIGDDVTVTILRVQGQQVRIGVSAPRNIGIHREEVYGRIQRPLREAPYRPTLEKEQEVATP